MTVGADTAASAPSNPTVILVGGLMTLEDGEELDSRQPVEGDPQSLIVQRTLAGSLLWWLTTSSLVEAILGSAADPEPFSLLIGQRSVVELRPDGELRTTNLRSLLTAGVSNVTIGVSGRREQLDSKYTSLGELPMFGGRTDPNITYGVNLGAPGTHWRFLNGATAFLDHALPAISPTVIVDTDATSNHPPFAEFEAKRLRGDVTLVLPHSDATERYIRSILGWVREGRPAQELEEPSLEWAAVREAAVPLKADFGVTGLFQNGEWRDPADLEAARAFVQTRFDLQIGIWDLAENPSLRTSLLQSSAVDPAPTEPASVPKGSEKRIAERARKGEEREAARQRDEKKYSEALRTMRKHGEQLRPFEWEIPDPNEDAERMLRWGEQLRPFWWEPDPNEDAENLSRWGIRPLLIVRMARPLTPPMRPYKDLTPLAWLTFTVFKRTTCAQIQIFSLIYDQFPLRPYLKSKHRLLLQIAEPGKCDFGRTPPVLWEAKGGWSDDVDWPSRFAELGEKTSLWLDVFKDLSPKLFEAHRKSSSRRMA